MIKNIKIKKSNLQPASDENRRLQLKTNKMKENGNLDFNAGNSLIKRLRYSILNDLNKPLRITNLPLRNKEF